MEQFNTLVYVLKLQFRLVTANLGFNDLLCDKHWPTRVKVEKITAIMKLMAPEEKASNNQIVNRSYFILLQSNWVVWHLG